MVSLSGKAETGYVIVSPGPSTFMVVKPCDCATSAWIVGVHGGLHEKIKFYKRYELLTNFIVEIAMLKIFKYNWQNFIFP